MENRKSKQIILSVIGIAILIVGVVGVSFAFFNYTRTGSPNTIQVGRIAFNSTQNNTISLENVFPTSSNNLNNTNSDTITINITGDTTYSEGIEYKVTLEDVNNTINEKEIPMSFNVTASNLGTKDSSYYTNRGGEDAIYNLTETGQVEDDKYILVGYIPSGEDGVNGSIDITAYIDASNVAISDTVSRIEDGNLIYGETPGDWIAGRTVFTTSEWNSFNSGNPLSFKVRVEANEGIWVEEPQYRVLKSLSSIQAWKDIRANITSIEFHRDGVAPENPITSFDATDISSEGPITVYTVDDGSGNNTYKAIIVSDDVIYASSSMAGLFQQSTKLVTFNGENLMVDNVTSMAGAFYNCTSLENIIGIDNWNTSSLTKMNNMFYNCKKLKNVDALINFDTSNVNSLIGMFLNCTDLQNVNGLLHWDISNVSSINSMFSGCKNLQNVNGLINWNTRGVQDMTSIFGNCESLQNVDGLRNWNTSNVSSLNSAFYGCINLQNASGLANWNTSSVTNMNDMFNNCKLIDNLDFLTNWDMSRVTKNSAMFQNAGFTTIKMPNNYTRIDDFMFNLNDKYNGISFTIPNSVTVIGNAHIFYNFGIDEVFNKFIVESGSTSFKTIDDILYTYDGTRLISVPRGKTFTNNTFELPEGVTFLNELSFSRNQNIDTLVLPNSYVIERFIDESNNSYGFINSGNSLSVAIYVYTSIKRYEVKNDNTRYMSYGGCIYSKDETELIAVPLHYEGILNIKDGTTTIGQEAFWTVNGGSSIDSITRINIPASVTTIEANQLTTLNTLMSRSTKPVTITIDSGNTAYKIVNNKIVAI